MAVAVGIVYISHYLAKLQLLPVYAGFSGRQVEFRYDINVTY